MMISSVPDKTLKNLKILQESNYLPSMNSSTVNSYSKLLLGRTFDFQHFCGTFYDKEDILLISTAKLPAGSHIYMQEQISS